MIRGPEEVRFGRKDEHFSVWLVRILVVGSGGREHALVWRLCADSYPLTVYAAPGNPGVSPLARTLPCAALDFSSLLAAAEELQVDLTVVGPEAPLVAGIVDAFHARGLRIFGPTAGAAALEASKVFAKRLMRRYGIPTAAFEVFDDASEAIAYVRRLGRPCVIKPDGLAGGKGVVVADDPRQAEAAICELMVARVHGSAADRVIIEEKLDGVEVSVFALVGGGRFSLLPAAQDYKRSSDGDRGPNTGGMGAVAPAGMPPALHERIVAEIVAPIVDAMAREGRPYTGVLYAGIMVTEEGPYVLEFNCRLGDPETQVLLPLLAGDFSAALLETLDGVPPQLATHEGAAVCVVLASRGYPGTPELGYPIHGVEGSQADAFVFHAGTAVQNGGLVTAGGRVLNVVGTGRTISHAAQRAYDAVARVHFTGMHFRTDIGRELILSASAGEPGRRSTVVGGLPRMPARGEM